MKNENNDGTVIKKFESLSKRLERFDMHIQAWGRIAVCLDSNRCSGYILNNVTDIDVVEGFVAGLEYANPNTTNEPA